MLISTAIILALSTTLSSSLPHWKHEKAKENFGRSIQGSFSESAQRNAAQAAPGKKYWWEGESNPFGGGPAKSTGSHGSLTSNGSPPLPRQQTQTTVSQSAQLPQRPLTAEEMGTMGMCDGGYICVNYHLCDSSTGYIISDGSAKIRDNTNIPTAFFNGNFIRCGPKSFCCQIGVHTGQSASPASPKHTTTRQPNESSSSQGSFSALPKEQIKQAGASLPHSGSSPQSPSTPGIKVVDRPGHSQLLPQGQNEPSRYDNSPVNIATPHRNTPSTKPQGQNYYEEQPKHSSFIPGSDQPQEFVQIFPEQNQPFELEEQRIPENRETAQTRDSSRQPVSVGLLPGPDNTLIAPVDIEIIPVDIVYDEIVIPEEAAANANLEPQSFSSGPVRDSTQSQAENKYNEAPIETLTPLSSQTDGLPSEFSFPKTSTFPEVPQNFGDQRPNTGPSQQLSGTGRQPGEGPIPGSVPLRGSSGSGNAPFSRQPDSQSPTPEKLEHSYDTGSFSPEQDFSPVGVSLPENKPASRPFKADSFPRERPVPDSVPLREESNVADSKGNLEVTRLPDHPSLNIGSDVPFPESKPSPLESTFPQSSGSFPNQPHLKDIPSQQGGTYEKEDQPLLVIETLDPLPPQSSGLPTGAFADNLGVPLPDNTDTIQPELEVIDFSSKRNEESRFSPDIDNSNTPVQHEGYNYQSPNGGNINEIRDETQFPTKAEDQLSPDQSIGLPQIDQGASPSGGVNKFSAPDNSEPSDKYKDNQEINFSGQDTSFPNQNIGTSLFEPSQRDENYQQNPSDFTNKNSFPTTNQREQNKFDQSQPESNIPQLNSASPEDNYSPQTYDNAPNISPQHQNNKPPFTGFPSDTSQGASQPSQREPQFQQNRPSTGNFPSSPNQGISSSSLGQPQYEGSQPSSGDFSDSHNQGLNPSPSHQSQFPQNQPSSKGPTSQPSQGFNPSSTGQSQYEQRKPSIGNVNSVSNPGTSQTFPDQPQLQLNQHSNRDTPSLSNQGLTSGSSGQSQYEQEQSPSGQITGEPSHSQPSQFEQSQPSSHGSPSQTNLGFSPSSSSQSQPLQRIPPFSGSASRPSQGLRPSSKQPQSQQGSPSSAGSPFQRNPTAQQPSISNQQFPSNNQGASNPMMQMMMAGMRPTMTPGGTPLTNNYCSAGVYCVLQKECNPYTGFIIMDPSQVRAVVRDEEQVPLLSCSVPLNNNVQDGVCCQLPHPINGVD